MDPATLEIQLRFSHLVVNRNLQDVTHEESLRAPQPAGNCANWVLGHLVASRQHMLGLLGEPPLWDRARIRRFDRGSPAVTDAQGAAEFGGMLGRADRLVLIIGATLLSLVYPYPIPGSGLFSFSFLGWALVIFAIVCNVTALQRFISIWRRL